MNKVSLITITIADMLCETSVRSIDVSKINKFDYAHMYDTYYASIKFDKNEFAFKFEDNNLSDESIVNYIEFELTKKILDNALA